MCSFLLITMITILISMKECNEQCHQCEKKNNNGCMMHCRSIANFTHDIQQNIGLNQFIFSLKQHGSFHLVKVKLEIKHGRQQYLIFVNYLAQSCVGSRQISDVTRSIFCPNFCKLVTSILDLDLMKTFLKSMCLVRLHNPRNRNFDCQYFDNVSQR